MTTAADSSRLPSLTGVRAVAAFAVFLAHMRWVLPEGVATSIGGRRVELAAVLTWGGAGVSLFFVLSGFVLTWSWRPAMDRVTFYARRLGRIWPAHVVAAAAFLALELFGIGPRPSVAAVAAVVLLLQSWIPGAGWANAVNPAAWTLSCELFFYALFPFLVGPVLRMRSRALVALAVVPWALTLAVRVVVMAPRNIPVVTFPPMRLGEFVTGMAIARLVQTQPGIRFPSLPATLAVVFVYLAASTQIELLDLVVEAALPLAFALVIGRLATLDLGGRSGGLLRTPSMQYLGERSYCFYLVHLLPLNVIGWLSDGPRQPWGRVVLVAPAWFAVAALGAWLLHRFVEVPLAERVRLATGQRPAMRVAP